MRLRDRLIRRAGYWEGMASGAAVLTSSYGSPDREPVLPQLAAFAQQANGSSSPVFSAHLVRMALFSEITFTWQAKDDKHLWGNTDLAKLEEPFGPGSTTGQLLSRMEQDAFLAGQAYIWDPPGEDRLVRLRPDWTTIVSEVVRVENGTDQPGWYRRPVGYWWEPPKGVLQQSDGFLVPAAECVHFAPVPDPQANFRGMSPLTPVMRDIQGDDGMSRYKIRYLTNNATPNMIVKYAQKIQPGTVDAVRERMEARYGGPDNAGKTLILDQGADLVLAGNSLSQMDFSNVAAVGAERILAACSVPGVLVGLEPLRGAGRGYQESMQKLANIWARPQWRAACGALSQIVNVPPGNRLWFDTGDIAALQDGEMERGQAALVRAQALLALVQAGYTHESAVAAVDSMDLSQLKAAPVPPAPPAGNVQHLLPQTSPGVVADPLPPTMPRLAVGSTSPGDGGNNTRPTPRPASARRALEEANGRG
jgi:phage portal protein BeeE